MDPRRSFQGLILALQAYWADYGCVILQPYDMEVGAGTFHPATTLRALGPNPWNAAYVQPSRRPKDGRYGENPNRLQHYYQFQVILKPSPPDLQGLYLEILAGDRRRSGPARHSFCRGRLGEPDARRLGGDLHDERHVRGDERDVEHRLGHHRPDLRGRRAGGAEAGRGRRLPRLPGDVSADRPAGLRPGRRHVAGTRPRRRSRDRHAQGARRRGFRAGTATPQLRGGEVGRAASYRRPSGSTSKRDSAMPRRRPSGTRIRRSCSSPWGGGGGRQGISARTTCHAADPGTKGRRS